VSIGRIGAPPARQAAHGRQKRPMTIRRHRFGHAKLQHYPEPAHLTRI
jgi:hypothetical protein